MITTPGKSFFKLPTVFLSIIDSGRSRPPARAHGSLCTGAGSLLHTHRSTLSPESESRHGLMAVTMIGFRVVRECACAVHGRSVKS